MAFNFPNTPANGDRYSPVAGGPAYVYQNGVWMQTSQTGYRPTAQARNRIINPSMQISQQNGSAAQTASSTYPADQWVLGVTGIVASAQLGVGGSISPDNANSLMSLTATTAKASLAAGDYMQILQPFEGYDMADLQWGTANAIPIVLRFNAFCQTAGTYGINIRNNGGARSYLTSFTIAAASVWQTFALAIPGDITGTWPKDNTLWGHLNFTPAAGTTFTGAAAGWNAGNLLNPPGCSNLAAIANRVLYFTDVGLYADPDNTGLPPPWSPPVYADELLRCQRHWNINTITARLSASSASLYVEGTTPLAPIMRTTPSAALYSAGSRNNVSGIIFGPLGSRGGRIEATSAAAGDSYILGDNWALNARLV